MSNQNKKVKYPRIGSLTWQSEFDQKTNKPIKGAFKTDNQGRKTYEITLSDKVQILVDGKPLSGKKLYVTRTIDALNNKLEKGIIDQAEYDEKIAAYGKDGYLEFVQFEISGKME